MGMHLLRFVIAGTIVVAVTELSQRFPRIGALILTLPVVSMIAFVSVWARLGDMRAVSSTARETLILLPLSLPFFLPLAFAERLGLGFWSAFATGFVLTCATTGAWLYLGKPL